MISRKLSDAVSSARELLQDTVAPYRYSDDELQRYVAEGVATIYRIRPDLMETPWDVPDYATQPSDAELPSDIATFYYTPLVNFVAGRSELRDDQFATDGRAVTLISTMRSALLTPGG